MVLVWSRCSILTGLLSCHTSSSPYEPSFSTKLKNEPMMSLPHSCSVRNEWWRHLSCASRSVSSLLNFACPLGNLCQESCSLNPHNFLCSLTFLIFSSLLNWLSRFYPIFWFLEWKYSEKNIWNNMSTRNWRVFNFFPLIYLSWQ